MNFLPTTDGCLRTTRQWLGWWSPVYILDYVTVVALFLLNTLVVEELEPSTTLHDNLQLMSETQLKMYNFPFHENTYESNTLKAGIFGLAVVLIPVFSNVWNRRLHDVHNAFLGFLTSLSIACITAGLLKAWFGQLRPDFLDRCQPDEDFACTSLDLSKIKKGRTSFPSGHTTDSFAALGFFSIFLFTHIKPFSRNRKGGAPPILKLAICVAPLLWAAHIGATRVQDNRHFYMDVFWGGTFGLLAAFVSHSLYYPFFWRESSSEPCPRAFTTWSNIFSLTELPTANETTCDGDDGMGDYVDQELDSTDKEAPGWFGDQDAQAPTPTGVCEDTTCQCQWWSWWSPSTTAIGVQTCQITLPIDIGTTAGEKRITKRPTSASTCEDNDIVLSSSDSDGCDVV